MASHNDADARACAGSPYETDDGARYAAWFHELDAWTEYWDIYHPESNGRFYFGDGKSEAGLLTRFLPRFKEPALYSAWKKMALGTGSAGAFVEAAQAPLVADAVREVDDLMTRLFARHFGEASEPAVCDDYLEATLRFATDTLPPADERYARIANNDLRKRTAGRHTLDGDIMWFAWALHTEAADMVADPAAHSRRNLFLAAVAAGCSANFAWRRHRRTRREYNADPQTLALLRQRGRIWAHDFRAAKHEIHELFRIREWGEAD